MSRRSSSKRMHAVTVVRRAAPDRPGPAQAVMKETPMPPATPEGRVIGLKKLLNMIPLSRTTIWRLERSGLFPKRIQLTANRIGWDVEDVQRWIASRKDA